MGNLKNLLAGASVALLVGLGAAGAQASTLFSFVGPYGPVSTNDGAAAYFSGSAGAAQASFTLDGYISLDGQNYSEDDFTLSLNGSPILSGTWNLGGGGANVVFFAPTGSVITPTTFGFLAGGKVVISTPLTLISGTNSLGFEYESLSGPSHAGFQGTADEAWGVEKILVTQGAVPEPTTWALMLTGFGLAGAALRRRRVAVAA